MQVVILAGGFGTRLSEETDLIPKPMVRIGNIPILQHIMDFYSKFGHTDFVIALGYKAEVIKEYFELIDNPGWNINLVDTGLETSTGGRIKKLENQLDDEFLLTYGDGLSNVNIEHLLDHHQRFGKLKYPMAWSRDLQKKPLKMLGGSMVVFFVLTKRCVPLSPMPPHLLRANH